MATAGLYEKNIKNLFSVILKECQMSNDIFYN